MSHYPPGMTVRDLRDEPDAPPLSWPEFAYQHSAAAKAIETAWLESVEAWEHWTELDAARRDDAAFLARSRMFVETGRRWRLKKAGEWLRGVGRTWQ